MINKVHIKKDITFDSPEYECYERLAYAIVAQAVRDYRTAKHMLKLNPHDDKSLYKIKEIKRFFRSSWFGVLTGVDPTVLLEKLEEMEDEE